MERLILGNCIDKLKELSDNSVDAIITDPPYGLTSITKRFGKEGSAPAKHGKDGSFARLSGGFMGCKWDGQGIEYNVDMWREVLRVLKPGGHLISFGGSRTYHRMACAIEDAGFEIRDQIMWIYGSGFPKSLNIGKAIDKMQGNKRKSAGKYQLPNGAKWNLKQDKDPSIKHVPPTFTASGTRTLDLSRGESPYEGLGTALKPAHEPIVLARKPISESTMALNVLKWGVGGLAIDNCRVSLCGETPPSGSAKIVYQSNGPAKEKKYGNNTTTSPLGRFPANVIHDGSEEVVSLFPNTKSGGYPARRLSPKTKNTYGTFGNDTNGIRGNSDSGSAARFFYCAKTSKSERDMGCDKLPLKQVAYGNQQTAQLKRGEQLTPNAGIGEGGIIAPTRNFHPTVKPIALMKYLITLISSKGQTVMDPFLGSGSTGVAAKQINRNFIGIELNPEYLEIAKCRIDSVVIEKNSLKGLLKT